MPFFVAVYQDVQPACLEQVLVTMGDDFATSRRLHPGRRGTRVFQRLNQPTYLLAIGEWDSRADYDRLRQTPRYQEVTVNADPPARIEYLTRLRLFARMSLPPSVVGSVVITAPGASATALEAYMLGEVSRGVEGSVGLVSHELYRMGEESGRVLAVHSWRSIEDLERFRAGVLNQFGATLLELGATTERLTGVVAMQFSRLET